MKTVLYLIGALFCKAGIFIGIIGTGENGLHWETVIGAASFIALIYLYKKLTQK